MTDDSASNSDDPETDASSADADPAATGETPDADGIAEPDSPFLEAVATPIREDEPTGDSVTYDEDFRAVKQEIDAISSPGTEADFEVIVERGRRILTEKSKDLRAASYLAIGEARVHGVSGVAESLRAVRLLIETYWDDLYPAKSRMRGRGSALQIVADRIPDWLTASEVDETDREDLGRMKADLEAIQAFTLEEMGEHAPAFSALLNAVEEALGELPDPEPDTEATDDEAETKTDETGAGESEDAAGREPSSTGGADEAEQPVTAGVGADGEPEDIVVAAAARLREDDLSNPAPYRLLRAVRWSPIDTVPPNEEGTTQIPAPREQRRSYLTHLLEQQKHEELIEEGEAAFQEAGFHVWLDLQRLIATALQALGEPYGRAHTAVLHDLALLLRRLPRLPHLSFRDGTPFVGPQTQGWIDATVQPSLGEEAGSEASRADSGGQPPAQEDFTAARQHLGEAGLSEAVSRMKDGASADRSEKDRFYRRLYTARLCMEAGHPAVARPMLDALADEAERRDLGAWDPALALTLWSHQCRCYDALAQEASADQVDRLRDRADAAYERICRVDAEEALSLAERRP